MRLYPFAVTVAIAVAIAATSVVIISFIIGVRTDIHDIKKY